MVVLKLGGNEDEDGRREEESTSAVFFPLSFPMCLISHIVCLGLIFHPRIWHAIIHFVSAFFAQ